MRDIFRLLKPGVGWAQCAEVHGHVFGGDPNDVPADSVLEQVHCNPVHVF